MLAYFGQFGLFCCEYICFLCAFKGVNYAVVHQTWQISGMLPNHHHHYLKYIFCRKSLWKRSRSKRGRGRDEILGLPVFKMKIKSLLLLQFIKYDGKKMQTDLSSTSWSSLIFLLSWPPPPDACWTALGRVQLFRIVANLSENAEDDY